MRIKGIRLSSGLFVLSLLCTTLTVPSLSSAFVDHGQIRSLTLENGLEVLVRAEPAQKVVELQAWVGVGSRDEPAGKEGIAHLFEHMLFKGTATRGVGEIARTIEAAGGDINAYTSMEHTVYHITIAAPFLRTGFEVLADAVQNSSFDAGELEREKLVVIEEIHRGRDSPSRLFSEELFRTAYTVHPYGRTVIGTPESVSSVTRQDMLEFFRSWYVPSNMKLVVVGGASAEEAFSEASRLFLAPPSPRPSRMEAREPEQTAMRLFRLVQDSDPARLAVAFPIGRISDPETPVLDLLAAVLSQGGGSRLPLQVRDSGRALAAWAYAYTPRDPGLFVLGATSEPEGAGRALEALLEQLGRLQEEPVPMEELDRARDQIINARIYEKERVEGQANEIGYMALTLDDTDFDDVYLARLQSVDAQDLREEARRVFTPGKATVGFMTRKASLAPDDEEVAALLSGSLGRGAPEAAREKRPVVHRGSLPNGITLLVQEDNRLPLVSIRAAVLGGTRFEQETTQGAFNLLAQLLARGTARRSAAELALALDGMSASLSGFSGRQSFGVSGKFLSRDAAEGMSLVREVLTGAALPADELELVRQRVISSIRAKKDDLPALALDLFRQSLYAEHPFRFPLPGTEDAVGSLSREDLLSLYRKVVQPQGMVISVAGDLGVDQAYSLVQSVFGDLEGSSYDPGPLPREIPRKGVREERMVRRDKAQTHVILGYLGPVLGTADADALEVLNAVLAGQGGRLFSELRDRRSLAYSVFSFVAPGLDPGYIAFGIAVDPEREKEAVEGFLEQIRLVRDQPVPEDELERARRYLIGSNLIGLQTLDGRSDQALFPVLYGQDLERALDYEGRIDAVTADQVRQAAVRYLDPEGYTLAVVEGKARSDAEAPHE